MATCEAVQVASCGCREVSLSASVETGIAQPSVFAALPAGVGQAAQARAKQPGTPFTPQNRPEVSLRSLKTPKTVHLSSKCVLWPPTLLGLGSNMKLGSQKCSRERKESPREVIKVTKLNARFCSFCSIPDCVIALLGDAVHIYPQT